MAEYGRGKGVLNYLPIVPKACIYVLKVLHKPVIGGNIVSETFMHMFHFQSGSSFRKVAQAAKSERDGRVWEGRVC